MAKDFGAAVTLEELLMRIGEGTLITKNVEPRSLHSTPDTPKCRLDSAAFLRLTTMK